MRREASSSCSTANTRLYERDLLLQSMSATSLFYEYLELAIQYGFIVMFIVAFPLSPFFSLLNNLFEVRVDARKFLLEIQRPVPQDANGIGIWYFILRAISRLAIITNSIVIAFTSDTIQRLFYRLIYSKDGSLTGYVMFTLSKFNVSEFSNDSLNLASPGIVTIQNVTECWYRDFRNPPESIDRYEKSPMFFRVTVVKLIFIILFECVLSLSIGLIDFLVAKLPSKAKKLAVIEQNIVQNLRWSSQLNGEHLKKEI